LNGVSADSPIESLLLAALAGIAEQLEQLT
jgi:hypothetical protein